MNIFTALKTALLLTLITLGSAAYASGGYDNGTPAGKGHLDLDFTINPGNQIDNGQSYIVWGYGITEKLDFHGYVSHEDNGTNQIYYGLMYNFISNRHLVYKQPSSGFIYGFWLAAPQW